MNTPFNANAPHPNAINKAEALNEWVEAANELKFDRESAFNGNDDKIVVLRKCGMTKQTVSHRFYFDGFFFLSFVGSLFGSVFSRSLISCTSNSKHIYFLAPNRINASFKWLRQPFRASTKLTMCSLCHSNFGWLCAILRCERIIHRCNSLRCVRLVMIYWKNKCESRRNSSKYIGHDESQWDWNFVAMDIFWRRKSICKAKSTKSRYPKDG